MSNKVDQYILKHPNWTRELELLREVVGSTGLEETLKWSTPVFVDNKKNIVGIGAFKAHVALWFFQGVMLGDKKKKLLNAQEGTTSAMRQWRFTNFEEIADEVETIVEYVQEATENERNNKVVKPNRSKPLVIPELLQKALDDNEELKVQFELLNLTKKREFAYHIESAKRLETKQSRLEKIIPMIFDGRGLNDKYRK